MKKLINKLLLLFTAGILLGACSSEDTPSGGVDKPFSPSSYPDKISLSKPSLFVKDSTLKGYLPYPVVPGINTEGFNERMNLKSGELFLELGNSNNGYTYIYDSGSSSALENEKDHDINLFKGQETNIKLNTSKFDRTNRFCMNYFFEDKRGDDFGGASIYYKQTSDTTFEKIGIQIWKDKQVLENSGKQDC